MWKIFNIVYRIDTQVFSYLRHWYNGIWIVLEYNQDLYLFFLPTRLLGENVSFTSSDSQF